MNKRFISEEKQTDIKKQAKSNFAERFDAFKNNAIEQSLKLIEGQRVNNIPIEVQNFTIVLTNMLVGINHQLSIKENRITFDFWSETDSFTFVLSENDVSIYKSC